MSKIKAKEEYSIDCVMTLQDFYIIHASLRLMGCNLDFMRDKIFEAGDEVTLAEERVESVSDKVDLYIKQLQEERNVLN